MKKCIHLFLLIFCCALLTGCVLSSNNAPESVVTVDQEYVNMLINTALTADTYDEQYRFLIDELGRLDKKQRNALYILIKNNIENNKEEILPFGLRQWRAFRWICNYIDYEFNRMEYVFEIEGDIGPVDPELSVTARFYKVKSGTEKEISIAVAEETIQHYNNEIVPWHDWECSPNRVRVLLIRSAAGAPNAYVAGHIFSLPEASDVASIWSQCQK